MENILWIPAHPEKTQMARFLNRVNEIVNLEMKSYDELFNWSVKHSPDFWAQIWDFCEIKHSIHYTEVVDDDKKMPGAKWFSGAKLNFAENMLRYQDDQPAIHFKGEGQPVRSLTYQELFNEVEKVKERLCKMLFIVFIFSSNSLKFSFSLMTLFNSIFLRSSLNFFILSLTR